MRLKLFLVAFLGLFLVLSMSSVRAITVTFREGGTGVDYNDTVNDTALSQYYLDTNYGNASDWGRIGCNGGSDSSRFMIWFNLSRIPSNAVIISSKLNLTEDIYCYAGNADPYDNQTVVELHRGLVSWAEDYPTWNNFTGEGNYSAQIYDYYTASCDGATAHTDSRNSNHIIFNSSSFTDLIQAQVNGTYPNYGYYLKGVNEICTDLTPNETAVYPSESVEDNKPILTIEYTIPSSCPLSISSSGSYVLSQNISSSGDCVSIESNDVVLDCQGYSITGDDSGIGINVSSSSNVTIRNCSISNFYDGIYMNSTDNISILDNDIGNVSNFPIEAVTSLSNVNIIGNKLHNYHPNVYGYYGIRAVNYLGNATILNNQFYDCSGGIRVGSSG